MVFKCQSDSFLKEFESRVISCEKTEVIFTENGKLVKKDMHAVILEDTILFPEGGGQPSDHGFFNNIPVKQVIRKEDKAIHYTEKAFNVGETVKQIIDWERRFDHMQQHSGQHLLTAMLEKKYKIPTISWWLGEELSYVELGGYDEGAPTISTQQLKDTEDVINEIIRNGNKVTVQIFNEDTPEEDLKEARSNRGLPNDHKGDKRVINIDGIDSSLCCGTHVNNLSQLQALKLLHSEKKKNKTLLYFLFGNRVIQRLNTSIEREQKLTKLLKNNPDEHASLIEKLQKNVKLLNKNLQSVLKDIALVQAKRLNETCPTPQYYFYHKSEADPDFMNTFIRELGRSDIFLFLSTGDDKKDGNIVLYGNEKAVDDLKNLICDILQGKGAVQGNKFQAKVSKMANLIKAQDYVIKYFKEE